MNTVHGTGKSILYIVYLGTVLIEFVLMVDMTTQPSANSGSGAKCKEKINYVWEHHDMV